MATGRQMILRQILICLFIIGAVSSCTTDTTTRLYSESKDAISAYNLFTAEEAHTQLTTNPKDYIPIQVSKKKSFLEGHLPTAQNIWRPDYGADTSEPYGGLIPSKEKLEGLLQSLGYEKGKMLLLYDTKANVDALRFAWVLNLYGFDNFKILNGGLAYWKQAGFPVTKRLTAKPPTSNYKLPLVFKEDMIAYFDDVKSAITDTNTILLDTRESYEYKAEPYLSKGQVFAHKPGAFNRGSIPSAIHLNWSTFTDLKGDHRIKSERDLRYDLDDKGISPDKNIILYCQSGSRTSHTYYVLKHVLGYEKVRNYDGSWIEWSYNHSLDSSLPMDQHCSEERFSAIEDSLNLTLKNVN